MKIMNNYTLEDLCNNIPVASVDNADSDRVVSVLEKGISSISTELSQIISLNGINKSDLYRMKQEGGSYVINDTFFSRLINLIRLRYDNHYCVASSEEINFNSLSSNKELKTFCKKFVAILISSKDKYLNILNIYKDNISKLMDGLKGSIDTTHENHKDEDYDNDVSGLNLFNDTPQTTDVVATIEGNQYVTELSKSSAHTDNTGEANETGENHSTSESNTKYVMEKIKDIQDSYEKVLYKWSEEFDGLFIEESMVL